MVPTLKCWANGVKLNKSVIEQTPVTGFRQVAGKMLNETGDALVANVEAMVQDFMILGDGLVKEIECNVE